MDEIYTSGYDIDMPTKKQSENYEDVLRQFIAKRLRALRVGRNLTQLDIAELSGLPQPRIATAESGKYHMKTGTLARIIAALDMHPSEFFAGAPRPSKPKPKKET